MSRRSNPNAYRSLSRRRGVSRERRVVYVVVEGGVTEVDYLAYLKKELVDDQRITLHVIARQEGLKPQDTVDRILEIRDETRRERDENVELWVMFDRDEHIEIPQAFARARSGGVHVAFSHPSFDLWLLLHFAAFSGAQNGSSRVVQEKLRRHSAFEKFGEVDKSIKGGRIAALRGKEQTATTNARRLTKDCPISGCSEADSHVDHCDPLNRDPSTDVWKLLASLKIIDG